MALTFVLFLIAEGLIWWATESVVLVLVLNVCACVASEAVMSNRRIRKRLRSELAPPPEPELPVRMLDPYVPKRDEQALMEIPLHVIGPLAQGPDAMRRAGICGECPAEFVIDRGGFMVSSPDPTAHPGSIPYCYRPRGHEGRHTWQAEEAVSWPSS